MLKDSLAHTWFNLHVHSVSRFVGIVGPVVWKLRYALMQLAILVYFLTLNVGCSYPVVIFFNLLIEWYLSLLCKSWCRDSVTISEQNEYKWPISISVFVYVSKYMNVKMVTCLELIRETYKKNDVILSLYKHVFCATRVH